MAQETSRKTVKVVVLGDIGRSPRMQYHSLSLAEHGLHVQLVGYVESTPLPALLQHERVTISRLHPLNLRRGPRLFQYILKTIWQAFSLFLTLLISGRCDFLLCQNPPAVPTLPICRFYSLITQSKFIIDWHNYAYTIMGLSLPAGHPLLKLATAIERFFGASSHYNLCVTYAMKNDLIQNWNIKATVLYDRPPKIFRPLSLEEKHDWFIKMSQQYTEFSCSGKDRLNLPSGDSNRTGDRTVMTQYNKGKLEMRIDRPGILFSSTSWTPDEDFSILLEALQVYETTYKLKKQLPKLICVITGKGPMKSHYLQQITARNWQHVKVVTPWLEATDYPKMVASADLGVCLHTSSSGLDLPMKVVDMFGAGLPVCACHFSCIDELVKHGKNGFIFRNSEQLAHQITDWFKEFPHNVVQNELSKKMRNELKVFQDSRWENNWDLRVKDYFHL